MSLSIPKSPCCCCCFSSLRQLGRLWSRRGSQHKDELIDSLRYTKKITVYRCRGHANLARHGIRNGHWPRFPSTPYVCVTLMSHFSQLIWTLKKKKRVGGFKILYRSWCGCPGSRRSADANATQYIEKKKKKREKSCDIFKSLGHVWRQRHRKKTQRSEAGGEEITQKNNVIAPKASANTRPKNSSGSLVTNIWPGSAPRLVESGDKLAICCMFSQNLKGSQRETLRFSVKITGNKMKRVFTPRRGRPLITWTKPSHVYRREPAFLLIFIVQNKLWVTPQSHLFRLFPDYSRSDVFTSDSRSQRSEFIRCIMPARSVLFIRQKCLYSCSPPISNVSQSALQNMQMQSPWVAARFTHPLWLLRNRQPVKWDYCL